MHAELSFTPGRAALVDFVRVALYAPKASGGSALSTAPTASAAPANAGWEALTGQRVCFVQGYYAIAFIAQVGWAAGSWLLATCACFTGGHAMSVCSHRQLVILNSPAFTHAEL